MSATLTNLMKEDIPVVSSRGLHLFREQELPEQNLIYRTNKCRFLHTPLTLYVLKVQSRTTDSLQPHALVEWV